ncbi:MAG: MucB/RseB C-terminal domain-containing protein [Gammaproteobacteria bacterium]|nr:MucB/RseB C-terminal domain-containing protein [Gammaproteobacteria bacterium]
MLVASRVYSTQKSVPAISRGIGVAVICSSWLAAAVADDSPQDWLDRMAGASGKISYRGTLVHMCGGKVDVVKVVHRVQDGRITERVKSLDADGREIIRNPEEVMCILPDQRTVLVGAQQADGHADHLLEVQVSFANLNDRNYRLQTQQQAHVAGRVAEVIAIRPIDNFRFGYRLWIDREHALPLKYELLDERGESIEQTLYTQISFTDGIRETEVEPTIVMDSFVWHRSGGAVSSATDSAAAVPDIAAVGWRVEEMPSGFELVAVEAGPAGGAQAETRQLVYSDGLASVSVFIESEADESERRAGASEMGAMNAYTTMVDEFLVTAVGGVPLRTATMMALSVTRTPVE